MSQEFKIVSVDGSNVDRYGFFCYKSKPKSQGYQLKLEWLRRRFDEGLRIKIVLEGARSVGFIESIPGEYTWRVVEAPNYLVVHCLWVVGRAKKKGFGSCLLEECVQDARQRGLQGVVMVSSRGNWLAHEKVFLRNSFECIDTAPPSFKLLLRPLQDGPVPSFPQDWEQRATAFGQGTTVVYADQCPYMPDAVSHAVGVLRERGIEARVVKLESAEAVRSRSPSAYGVFGIVHQGKLVCYHYLGTKELRLLDEVIAGRG